MSTNSNEHSMQTFRIRLTDEIIHIPAIIDAKTGQSIVLWSDVQDVFENAKYIRNGESLVPFMKDDDNNRIMPLRIAYYPGVVLEVAEGVHGQADTSRDASSFSNDTLTGKASKGHSYDLSSELPSGYITDTNLLAREVATLSIADTNTDHDALVKYSGGIPEEAQSSLRAYNQLYGSYLEAIISGQQMQAASIKQSMNVHFDRLQSEMDKNKALQEQLVNTQQEMQQLQQQTREEQQKAREELLEKQLQMQQLQEQLLAKQKSLDEKQDRMLQMQQQALNRLAIIQNRVQALLIQTYELHEYPIPRLFIILPKATGLLDRVKKPFAHQFRLYFLCECGTHTMPDDCKTQHEIHLAKHDGYDLDKPTEFFEKYGTYLLAMMYMIKYGIVAAGLIVPPLANFKIADELVEGQKHVEYLKKNIAPLVDSAINYLQKIRLNTEAGAELVTDHTEIDKLEALEGADLRQLESYLKVKDQGRVLGNLYRIVTLEGHVKWVCFDHYRANYQEKAMQQLRDIIQVNDGKFIEEIGRIEIKIATSIQARQFYSTLTNARGIQELEIALEWDATMDDLRAFARNVTTANVIRLTVDGTHFKRPALDIANRSRRFDPIAQLAFNARVQSLHLKGFDDFFSRVSSPALSSAPKFRVFSMDSNVSKDKIPKSFNGFLDCCPFLTTIELKFQKQWAVTKMTNDILRKLLKLESLKVDRGNFSFTAKVSDGKIQDMATTTERFSDLALDDLNFIRQGDLTSLSIAYTPQKTNEDQLVDILRHSPRLNTLRIGCQEARCLAVVNLVVFTIATLLQGASQLRIFELMEEKEIPFNGGGLFDENTHVISQLSFTEKPPTFHMPTWIQLQDNRLITEIFDHYPSLTKVELRFDDQYPLTETTRDILSKLRNLESLDIDHGNFSFTASVLEQKIQVMAMTTERLSNLGLGDLNFIRQGDLTSLAIAYSPEEVGEDQLVDILRHSPRLNTLRIGCQEARCLAIVNLVVSTRALLLQGGGSSQLRTFELTEENLVPFDENGSFDDKTHFKSSLSFAGDSPTFDMRTWIRPQCQTLITEQDPICDFVREYGWSIVDLRVFRTLTECFVTILDEITGKRGSQLEIFIVDPLSLTDSGLDHLDKIMERSPRLQNFWPLLSDLEKAGHVEKAQLVLSRYGKTLSGLPDKWLPQIASSFPTRNSFPNLDSFKFQSCYETIPSNCVAWIVTMISSPSQEIESTSMDNVVGQESPGVSGSGAPSVTLRHVSLVGLYEIRLNSEGWKTVIEALDLSTLKWLSFWLSNFGEEQLKLLVDRIPDNTTKMVPLQTLQITGTDVVKNTDSRALETMLTTLRAKVPLIEIEL